MEDLMNSIIDNIAKTSPTEGTFLGEDGLLHCEKCGGKRQTRIALFGKDKVVPCICQCRQAELEAEEAERQKEARLKKISQYRQVGFPEADFAKSTFASDDLSNPKLSRALKNYVVNFQALKEKGKGLILYGTVGTGKTFGAACVVNALIDEGVPCLMTNFARLTNELQGKFEGRQEYIDNLNKFDLLVIDDLAVERDTEFVLELVYNIIDSRYRSGLPMILTTNLTLDELCKPSDLKKQRIYNRILERCYPIEVKGVNRRGKKFKEDYNDMKELLGL